MIRSKTIALLVFILVVSADAHAFNWYKCGKSGYIQAVKHDTVDIPIYLSALSFPNLEERQFIQQAIESWGKSQTGKNNLNVYYAGNNTGTDIEVAAIQSLGQANNVPEELILLAIDAAHDEDGKITVYKRKDTIPEMQVPNYPGSSSPGHVTLPFTISSSNPACSNATTQQYFDDDDRSSMDVVINEGAIQPAANYTEYPRYQINYSIQPKIDINLLVAHEIGHVVGLDHSDEPYSGFVGEASTMIKDYPFAGNYSLDSDNFSLTGDDYGARYAKPMSDEVKALRSLYANGGNSFQDLAINQYNYKKPNNDPPKGYSLGLYNQSNFSVGSERTNTFLVPYRWEGFVPISIHNYGSSGRWARVAMGWWPVISDPPSNVWDYHGVQSFNVFLDAGAWITGNKSVWGPSPSSGTGFTWRYHQVIWNKNETGDSRNYNDIDVSAKKWYAF